MIVLSTDAMAGLDHCWQTSKLFCYACNGTGECFITLPLSPASHSCLEEAGSDQEEAAKTLGANDWQIFWRTLPNISWGLLYGILTN